MIIDLAARHIETLRAEYASISAELLARARFGVAPGQYLTARDSRPLAWIDLPKISVAK